MNISSTLSSFEGKLFWFMTLLYALEGRAYVILYDYPFYALGMLSSLKKNKWPVNYLQVFALNYFW